MSLAPVTTSALAREGIRHGFFTREGGVSEGIYASLNLGKGSSDAPTYVTENRARVAAYMGTDEANLLSCHQIHSPDVVTVNGPWQGARPEADAMVTDRKGVALGILTADCAPILFADADAGVIGAAHAGWKGAFSGVIGNTVAAMEALGASRGSIIAAIGPCIGPASYEVSDAFAAHFGQENACFFRAGRQGHAYFDLPAYVLHRLENAGIRAIWCGLDTLEDEARFFSYRRKTLRNEPDYGRQISAICLTTDL